MRDIKFLVPHLKRSDPKLYQALTTLSDNIAESSGSSATTITSGAGISYLLSISLTSNIAISSGVVDPVEGDILAVKITQDTTGGHTITWGVEFSTTTPTNITPVGVTKLLFVFQEGLWECYGFTVYF